MAQTLYVNLAACRVSLADVSLYVAAKSEPTQGLTAEGADAILYMSPVTAKLLLQTLGAAVGTWEKMTGSTIATSVDRDAAREAVKDLANFGAGVRALEYGDNDPISGE